MLHIIIICSCIHLFQQGTKKYNLSSASLSPIVQQAELTASEAGSECPGSLQALDDHIINSSQIVVNDKHFSRNQRLHDPKIVSVSARKSLRLGTPKKDTTSSKVSTSKVINDADSNVSSCHDTAPIAKGIPKAQSTPNSSKNTKKNVVADVPVQVLGTLKIVDNPKQTELTAKDRYLKLTGKNLPTTSNKKPTDIHPQEKELTQIVKGKGKGRGKSTETASTQDQSETNESDNSYGVEINPLWYEQTGSNYRKMKQLEMVRKKREKEANDPLLQIMKEKSENIQKLTQAFEQKSANPMSSGSSPGTPEQLWADSLVPHLMRMNQDTRDDFMVHVLGLAFKAISGKWP